MQGKLYAARDDVRTFKLQITANYAGKPILVCSDPPDFELGVTNKSEAFLEKFPLGMVPALETASGETLVNSDAIAFYLSSSEMRGCSEFQQAQVQQFVGLAESEVMPACCSWVYPTLGIMQPNKANVDKAKETVKKILTLLDQHLATRTFLVGERVSLADISMTCSLLLLYKQVLEPDFRGPYVNANRWFLTCINQPNFKAVIGEWQLCEKMAQFDSKKFNELNKKEGGGKKGKVPAATPEKKKEEKKEPAAVDELDEDELARQAEPKFVDPYKGLPPANLDMDTFKSKYSNEDIEAVALPFLLENVNLAEHSFWYCDYEYLEELNLPFMANNLINGFFQRIEKLRKTAFSVMCVLEKDDKAVGIRGVWIFRGQEKAFDLAEDWNVDAPSYKFRKLALEGEDKQLICDYFLRKEVLENLKVYDFKVFK